MNRHPQKTLYICYFGLREPLVETQVVSYLKELAKGEIDVSLLTFEPDLKTSWKAGEIESERARLKELGITWHFLPYHKRPSAPATLFDVVNGARFIRRLLAAERFDILHARIHVPAMMAVVARRLSSIKPKIIFDIRGFFPEEYTDAGIWPAGGWLYRSVKRVERWLLAEVDGFVVLTEKARSILFPDFVGSTAEGGHDSEGRPVEVIPCCVDIERFARDQEKLRDVKRRELGLADRFVLAYVGSFGGWYLSDEMFDMFAAIKTVEPSLFVMILTQRQAELARDRLEQAGLTGKDYLVKSVPAPEVADYLTAADAAVSFIKPCYSKQASSPTKNAEYLASGLPFIANVNVGDVDRLITEEQVGVLVDRFETDAYVAAFQELKELGDISQHCREVARRRFDLETVGGMRYRRLYAALSER